VRALLGPRLTCEASADWRVVCILLAIVFSVASAVPLAAQVPLATPGPGKHHAGPPSHGPQDYVPPSHGPPSHGPPGHGPQGHGPPGHGPPGHGPPGHDPPDYGDGGQRDADSVISPLLVAIGVVAFIVYLLKREERKKKYRRPPPKVEVVPVNDYGEQHVIPRPPRLAVELCPVLDAGNQALDKASPLAEQRGGQWTSNLQR
jgi:hypothetical protein